MSVGTKWLIASFLMFGGVIAALTWILSGHTNASSIYQLTEKIRFGLQEIENVKHVSNEKATYFPYNRQERHVMQKVRDLSYRLNVLLRESRLREEVIPILPVMRVTPNQLKVQMLHLYEGVGRLRGSLGLSLEFGGGIPLVEGKTATDVYASLQVIEKMFEALGVPKTTASDSYRVASIIEEDIQYIMQNRFHMCDNEHSDKATGKTASEVYAYAFTMLGEIHELTRREFGRFAPDNMHVPQLKQPPITEEDVIDLLDQTVADVGALKHAMGLKHQSVLGATTEGKTHSDVYNMISHIEHALACRLNRSPGG
ncbi:MAG: hypothetical protein JKY49_18180 [Cohaesibacteraceae bacterium]|nr:hypothetical protein [Cohaesibacteraceae bacterium]